MGPGPLGRPRLQEGPLTWAHRPGRDHGPKSSSGNISQARCLRQGLLRLCTNLINFAKDHRLSDWQKLLLKIRQLPLPFVDILQQVTLDLLSREKHRRLPGQDPGRRIFYSDTRTIAQIIVVRKCLERFSRTLPKLVQNVPILDDEGKNPRLKRFHTFSRSM